MRRAVLFLAVALLWGVTSLAQQADAPEDDGFLVRIIQNALSAPGRTVNISGISGVLSSQASIDRIVVSDADGEWLTIADVAIDWSRLALFRRRLDIESLTIGAIEIARPPLPAEPERPTLADAEARPFSLPELPVQVRVADLAIDRLALDEPVLGQAAVLRIAGSASLVRGEIDTSLAIEREDGPGGSVTLDVAFSNATRVLDLSLALREPEGGLVATALNIEGRPALELTLEGSGPLDDVDFDFALDAGGERLAEGLVALRSSDAGLGFTADFSGTLSPLVPAAYRDFFAGESTVAVAGLSKAGGGVRLDRLAVTNPALTIEGNLDTGPDGFLTDLALTGDIGDPRAPALTLPVPGATTTLNSGTLYVRYGEGTRWNGLLVLDRLGLGDVMVEDATLTMGGLARNLQDPAAREVTVFLEGIATGIWAEDPQVRAALGDRIDLFADLALPSGEPLAVRQVQVSGNGLSLFTAGTLEDLVYNGRTAARIGDIRPLSALAGRPLAGGIDVRATGDLFLRSAGFDLELDGTAEDLVLGDPRLDALLAGTTTLSGGLTRDESGLSTRAFRVENPQIAFTSDGIVSSGRTDIGFDARLADLALLSPQLSGAATATGRARGAAGDVAVSAVAAVPTGSVQGRPLTGAEIGFSGTVREGTTEGNLSGTGQLAGAPISLAGALSVGPARRALSDFAFRVGPNAITGTVAQEGDAPVEGTLSVNAPEVGTLAALALVEAGGRAEADVRLYPAEIGQGVGVTATLRDFVVGATRVGRLDLGAEVTDALGVPTADARLDAGDLLLGGVAVTSLGAEANTTGRDRMDFSAQTRLEIGTEAALGGSLERLEDGLGLALDRLTLTNGVDATLAAPTRFTLRGETIELAPLALDVGTGRITAEGSLAETFDLDLAIRDLPLALANAVQPALGLAGTVAGTARVTGPRAEPNVTFDLAARDVGAAALAAAGLPALGLEARGRTDGNRLTLDAALSGDGLAASVRGSAPLGPQGELALEATLDAFPLRLIDRLAGNRGLQGSVTGTARIGGTPASPSVFFQAEGSALTATLLQENGVPPLSAALDGRFETRTLTLTSATVSGPGGISVEGSGTVPLGTPGLNANVSGRLPLSLADAALAERTAQAAGELAFSLALRGSLAAPDISGPVTIAGGTFVDPQLNLRFEDITLDAALTGTAVRVDTLSARGAQGGTVNAAGTLGLGAGLPADLRVAFRELRLTDGAFYTTTLTGDLALTGPVTGGGGRLAGRIDLGQTEISVAEGLGGNAAAALEAVSHTNVPRPVARTLERARVGEAQGPQGTGAGGILLDVLISAPNRIFVRGRGLDVELGGELRIEGPSNDVRPVGEFNLIRGRLAILGQRIQFDEGALRLVGNLDPEIRFVAETRARDVTAFVTVEGRVSSPEITFSSIPERPEDEVLALVLFNRSVDNLSPFQIAQLAAAAAELAGVGGNGLLSRFRGATGLDDLDILTEEDGTTAVRAGRYINENLYLDVQTNSEGEARATVNLDITERFTARGSVETDGNSTIGIYYQRDY